MNHKKFAESMNAYTVLYVEDDNQIRAHISEFLSRYCKKVYACVSAEEGLNIYDKHKPDILLLDINLPGINGIDFATSIRTHDRRTRIVVLTAYTDEKFMIKAVELELTRYLVKPVISEDLISALKKCMSELEVDNIVNLGNGNIYSKKLTSIINNSEKIPLRKKEMEILEYFIEHEGEVVRYDTLENSVCSGEVMTNDAIRSQIRNIRLKIGDSCLENISGIGYKFKAPS